MCKKVYYFVSVFLSSRSYNYLYNSLCYAMYDSRPFMLTFSQPFRLNYVNEHVCSSHLSGNSQCGPRTIMIPYTKISVDIYQPWQGAPNQNVICTNRNQNQTFISAPHVLQPLGTHAHNKRGRNELSFQHKPWNE